MKQTRSVKQRQSIVTACSLGFVICLLYAWGIENDYQGNKS